MRTLYLHVGHMKTGTTYLQATFIENREILRAQGVIYPHGGRDETEIDLDSMTPVGNARDLLRTEKTLARGLRNAEAGQGVLFSSELLFNQIWNRDDLSWIPEGARRAGFGRVKMLLFVRDPVPLAVSIWQQRVKGWHGETRGLDEYVAGQFDWPERALRLLQCLDRTPGIELEFHNHAAVAARGGLLGLCETWLDLAPGSLAAPENEQANRSMTRSEAELQRLLNLHNGPSGALFAYPVTTRLTDVPRDPPRPAPEVARACLERLAPAISALEARLPEGEAFGPWPGKERHAGQPLAFSQEQMDILSRAIARATGADTGASPEAGRPAAGRRVPFMRRLRRQARHLRDRLAGRRGGTDGSQSGSAS